MLIYIQFFTLYLPDQAKRTKFICTTTSRGSLSQFDAISLNVCIIFFFQLCDAIFRQTARKPKRNTMLSRKCWMASFTCSSIDSWDFISATSKVPSSGIIHSWTAQSAVGIGSQQPNIKQCVQRFFGFLGCNFGSRRVLAIRIGSARNPSPSSTRKSHRNATDQKPETSRPVICADWKRFVAKMPSMARFRFLGSSA